MSKKLVIFFFTLMMIFSISCKKKKLNNDLCDCGDSESTIEGDTIGMIIPNVFTPNGDGINDRWEIDRLEYFENVTVKVVDEGLINRTVFESNGYENARERWKNSWDGKYKDKKLKDGKYFYEINFSGQTTTGYVCIFTIMTTEPDYRDCMIMCASMETGDPVLHP